jgi:hypothetical protein
MASERCLGRFAGSSRTSANHHLARRTLEADGPETPNRSHSGRRQAYPGADVAVACRAMIRKSMKSLVALAAFAPLLIGASAPSSQRPWRIVRHDYVEFCAGTTLTWDLHEGTLRRAKGACVPDRDSPPTITVAKLTAADLKRLRRLSEEALNRGIATQPCNSVPAHVLSGPRSFTVEMGGRRVHSPNCKNELGRRLEDAMAASIRR